MAQYYDGGKYYAGWWEGSRGKVEHDRTWDKSRDRDEHHEPSRGGDRR